MIKPRTIKQAKTECLAAWAAHPEATHGWCVHHCIEIEELSESIVSRIRYIVKNKAKDEQVTRLDNLRPVLSISIVLTARAHYREAIATAEKAYDKAIAPIAPALKAYNEATAPALKAYNEATATAMKAYNEATATARKAYNEAMARARKAYDEATAMARKAYDEAMAMAHQRDCPNHTWNGRTIFQNR